MDFSKLRATALQSGNDEEAVTVNTRALIDKVLARYSGEWTTLRELLQNAADAQASTVKIKFETFNDHNFLIDIAGSDGSVIQGLSLLQEELPAEISFHVPESYHKRIIGVGGRSIQRIMKKYGVYVKFSNAEEFAALGGYNDNEDNVVARTPAKNAINLDNLKQSVMELVNPKVCLSF